MTFDMDREDWRGFNRLRFYVRLQIQGARILHLNASLVNKGTIPIPDPYFREGATAFDPENGPWQECIWEFAAMPREAVAQLILDYGDGRLASFMQTPQPWAEFNFMVSDGETGKRLVSDDGNFRRHLAPCRGDRDGA